MPGKKEEGRSSVLRKIRARAHIRGQSLGTGSPPKICPKARQRDCLKPPAASLRTLGSNFHILLKDSSAAQLRPRYSWVQKIFLGTDSQPPLSAPKGKGGQQLGALTKDLPPPSQASLSPASQGVGQPRQRRHVAGAGRGCGSGPSSINPLGIWFLSTTPHHHPGGPSASAHGHPDTELPEMDAPEGRGGTCLSDLSTPGLG